MGLVWKITQNLISARLSLVTFDCAQILGSHFNNVAFFINCNVASTYVLKNKNFAQMSTILQESPFPVFLTDFNWVPRKSIVLII